MNHKTFITIFLAILLLILSYLIFRNSLYKFQLIQNINKTVISWRALIYNKILNNNNIYLPNKLVVEDYLSETYTYSHPYSFVSLSEDDSIIVSDGNKKYRFQIGKQFLPDSTYNSRIRLFYANSSKGWNYMNHFQGNLVYTTVYKDTFQKFLSESNFIVIYWKSKLNYSKMIDQINKNIFDDYLETNVSFVIILNN